MSWDQNSDTGLLWAGSRSVVYENDDDDDDDDAQICKARPK